MAILEVICKTAAIQNNSQWPCSMCPIPQLRLVGVRTSYIYIFSNISWTPSSGPHYKSLFSIPLGCTRLQEQDRDVCFYFSYST